MCIYIYVEYVCICICICVHICIYTYIYIHLWGTHRKCSLCTVQFLQPCVFDTFALGKGRVGDGSSSCTGCPRSGPAIRMGRSQAYQEPCIGALIIRITVYGGLFGDPPFSETTMYDICSAQTGSRLMTWLVAGGSHAELGLSHAAL